MTQSLIAEAPPTSLLRGENLCKSFENTETVQILNEVSIAIHPGETIAIVGSSGEGKSTLLHILGCLDKATSGALYYRDQPIEKLNANHLRNQVFGFIFQSFHLLEDLTVLENVLIPLKIARLPTGKNSANRQKAIELLSSMGLSHRLEQKASLLSGGEKQRTAIARALINDPELLLADEPTGNLDHRTAQSIQELLFKFVLDQKKALIVVTHNVELASLCQKRYQLQEGKLLSLL